MKLQSEFSTDIVFLLMHILSKLVTKNAIISEEKFQEVGRPPRS